MSIIDPVTVLTSGNNSVISVARSILDEAGIRYSLCDSKKSANVISIQVSTIDRLTARRLIQELEELDFEES